MPDGAVPRTLLYVAWLFAICLASTFAWWAAAAVARTEYRRPLSALACSMRIYFYSICLLCILVALKALHLAPSDPRSLLFGWIHVGGTVWICGPSAWRAFRVTGLRLAAVTVLGLSFSFLLGWLATVASPHVRWVVVNFPRFLTTA